MHLRNGTTYTLPPPPIHHTNNPRIRIPHRRRNCQGTVTSSSDFTKHWQLHRIHRPKPRAPSPTTKLQAQQLRIVSASTQELSSDARRAWWIEYEDTRVGRRNPHLQALVTPTSPVFGKRMVRDLRKEMEREHWNGVANSFRDVGRGDEKEVDDEEGGEKALDGALEPPRLRFPMERGAEIWRRRELRRKWKERDRARETVIVAGRGEERRRMCFNLRAEWI